MRNESEKESWLKYNGDYEPGSAYCKCSNPTVVRTLAKGTPAEKQYCKCGKRVDGREQFLDVNKDQ